MRKVLLATTALLAVGGVTAASADVSITGNYEFEYFQADAGDDVASDGNINFTGSIEDSNTGVTFSAHSTITNNDTNQNMEAHYIKAVGDFGTIYLGDADDSAATMMDGALGSNNDIETQASSVSTVVGIAGAADITWISPSISGFTIGLSKDLDDTVASATDGETDMALTYSIGAIDVYYGASADESSVAARGSIAGFTVAVGSNSTSGTSLKSNDAAVKYTLANGITVAAYNGSETQADGTTKEKTSNFGAAYTVTPGLVMSVETGDNNGDDYTWFGVNLSF